MLERNPLVWSHNNTELRTLAYTIQLCPFSFAKGVVMDSSAKASWFMTFALSSQKQRESLIYAIHMFVAAFFANFTNMWRFNLHMWKWSLEFKINCLDVFRVSRNLLTTPFLIFSKLGLDLVPRVGPFSVDPKDVGIVSLHNTHLSSDETAKNTSVRHFNINLSHFIMLLINSLISPSLFFRVAEHFVKSQQRRSSLIISTFACVIFVTASAMMLKFTFISMMLPNNAKYPRDFLSEYPKMSFQRTWIRQTITAPSLVISVRWEKNLLKLN